MLSKLIHAVAAVTIIIAIPAQANGYVRTEYTTVSQPRQVCWNEQVAVSGYNNNGGALIGGIAGGIIGNQVGRGNGRVVATAIGAATGSIVGDRLSYGGNRVSYQTVQRCKTVYDQVQVPVVAPVVQKVIYVTERPYYYEREHHHHHHDRDREYYRYYDR